METISKDRVIYGDFMKLIVEKKYKTKTSYMTSEHALYTALSEYEKISDLPAHKGYRYLRLSQDLDSKNQKVRARLTQLTQRMQKMSNIVFLD